MGDLMNDEARDKKVIGNLDSPKLPFDYMQRDYGTVPLSDDRAPFQWLSEVAYKNVHRIVARGYDTTELMEQGYGMTDMLFVNFQARIATVEEDRMLNYVMILALEDGLSLPALMSRMVARSKTFLTQAAGTSILAFGHAYGAFSAFGNMVLEKMQQAEASGQAIEAAARELVAEHLDDPALGISDLYLDDPAAKRMLARARKLGVAGPYIAFLEAMAEAARDISDTPVDVDLLGAMSATMMDLGFTPEATWAIVAVTRSFGAGAHYIEEVEREGCTRLGEHLTPKELYDGPEDRPVPPLADRHKHARSSKVGTPDEWLAALEERQKLRGSGAAIVEEIHDPSKKTGVRSLGKKI
jgi:citrate synthase